MNWFGSKQQSSHNEMGNHLPDEDAELCVESEIIQAPNKDKAKEKCEEIAESYGGVESKVKSIDKSWFDCTFNVWR